MNLNDVLSDFKRRYEQSYIWVCPPESSEEESLFYVNKILPDKTNIASLELTSPEYGKIILNMGTSHTLKFKYPPVGVFQNGVDAFMFMRHPAKQYKHGLYHGNSTCCAVHYYVRGKRARGGNAESLEFDNVLAAYRSEKYSFRDAIKMLKSGKYRSVALRDNFSVMLSLTASEGYVLMQWEVPVAALDVDGKVMLVYDKTFESVMDQVRNN